MDMNAGNVMLDKMMVYFVYPVGLLSTIYATLIGFGYVQLGAVDKSDEAAQQKRLKFLRWMGPFLIVGLVGLYILDILKLLGVC